MEETVGCMHYKSGRGRTWFQGTFCNAKQEVTSDRGHNYCFIHALRLWMTTRKDKEQWQPLGKILWQKVQSPSTAIQCTTERLSLSTI